MPDLTILTDEELTAANEGLMAERAEAERGFKAQQMAIAAEMDTRASKLRLSKMLDTLTESDKEALKLHLASIGPATEA